MSVRFGIGQIPAMKHPIARRANLFVFPFMSFPPFPGQNSLLQKKISPLK
jgi:hypothetical protein